jgi:hypothetical protein
MGQSRVDVRHVRVLRAGTSSTVAVSARREAVATPQPRGLMAPAHTSGSPGRSGSTLAEQIVAAIQGPARSPILPLLQMLGLEGTAHRG